MNIKEFVNERWTNFKPFTGNRLWKFYEMHILDIIAPALGIQFVFKSQKEFLDYELRDGDKVSLAKDIEVYGNGNTCTLTLTEVGKVNGVGPKLLGNIKEALGDVFYFEDLEKKAKDIKGLGKTTLERIKS
jgi:hypothetical protein